MANLLYVIRYFRVVPPIPRLMVGAFVVLTGAGGVMTATDPAQASAAIMPVVVLQAFSASTGFAAPARRGYFDLLFARGEPRVIIALVQWAIAVAPGVLSWAVLAAVHAMIARNAGNPVLASGTMTAMLLVSSIPWAVTIALPRFAGAIGWLLVVALGSVVHGIAWPDWIRALVYPVSCIGSDVGGHSSLVLSASLATVVAMAASLTWVHRADIPLEAAQ